VMCENEGFYHIQPVGQMVCFVSVLYHEFVMTCYI